MGIESALAHYYCSGKGIEIGAGAHNPFGLDIINVDIYQTDLDETSPFHIEQLRLCGSVASVDVVAPGDKLPFSSGSYDFVVSSHAFEHFPDPISALLEWDRVIKVGGVIFMIVPHKDRTFEKDRERTTLEHVIEDFLEKRTYEEGIKNGEGETPHYHCWITEDVINITAWTRQYCRVFWRVEEIEDFDDKVGNGFTVVIRKIGNRALPSLKLLGL